MSSIKIVSVPPGQAPESVRKEWIGVEIPLPEQSSGGLQIGVHGGEPENVGGYQVVTCEALAALRKKSPDAVRWWEDNTRIDLASHLVFSKTVCELIS